MKANPLACALLVLLAVTVQLPAQQPTTNAAGAAAAPKIDFVPDSPSGTNATGTSKTSAGDIFDRVAAEQATTNKPRPLTDAEVGLVPDSPSSTNTTRSQAIAAWLSKVTTTTTTRTTNSVTTFTIYRTNAVSQAEFAAIKTKAESGDPLAQYQLGKLYVWGVGGPKNAEECKKWILKAAENGLPEAQLDVGWAYFQDDKTEALQWFRKAAAQGYPEAQRIVGQSYKYGFGTSEDKHEAFIWYGKAAEAGDEDAQLETAYFYFNGIGVVKDAAKAAYWYQKAAEQGNADAQYRLAGAYETGEGVETNLVDAAKWYQQAAEQGNPYAQNWMGWAYLNGQGVETNAVEAEKWYGKAAEQGNTFAQYTLGGVFENSTGVAQDYAQALKWYLKAAEQGYTPAYYSLGFMYRLGKGVPQDYTEAAKWYRKSAEKDWPLAYFAQNDLGAMYAGGEGVPQDYVEAYKWFNLAAANGDTKAINNRNNIADSMTPDQIAEGQRLSREFKLRRASDSDNSTSPDNPTASGTGFFITDDGYLISNYHVVKDASRVRVVTSSGTVPAKVVQVDEANDIALLKAEGRFAPLPITSSRTVKLGGTVATVGFPDIGLQGFAPKLAKGEIASLSGAADDPRYFQISVPVQPGNSGGALVDERGNVVGIVSAKLSARAALAESGALPENVNYAVKSSFLLSFLESVPDVSAKLKPLVTADRKFEEVVKSAQDAAVLVLVY